MNRSRPSIRLCAAAAYGLCGLAGLRLDRLVELQLAVVDAVGAVIGERRVAVLVDRVVAEHALAVLGREEGLLDIGLLPGLGTLDGVEGQLHRLIAVERVRIRVLHAVLLGERLEELLTLWRVLVRRERRDGALDLGVKGLRYAAFLLRDKARLAHAVRAVELRVRP